MVKNQLANCQNNRVTSCQTSSCSYLTEFLLLTFEVKIIRLFDNFATRTIESDLPRILRPTRYTHKLQNRSC